MGIGLELVGNVAGRRETVLAEIERFFRERYGRDLIHCLSNVETGQVSVRTHPGAEDIELKFGDGSRLEVSAKTSTVGPGYHADVCEALDGLAARVGVTWEPLDEESGGDETSYFTTRDHHRLEREMLQWLRGLASMIIKDGPFDRLALAMPMTPQYHGPPGAALLTQLGPRDEAWLARVAEDPRRGIDLFPWWSPGRGAAYELGRVLVHMWLDVRFHPAATDDEANLAREVLERLGRAVRLDPSLDYPWAAWAMLQGQVDAPYDGELSKLVRQSAAGAGLNAIGYRAYDIDVSLPSGWRVTVPGSFSEQFEDGTWSAWENGRTVWATTYSVSTGDLPVSAERILPTKPREGVPTTIEALPSQLRYRAFLQSFVEEGQKLRRLATEIATDGKLLVLDVVFPDDSALDWARRVVGSVRR